jgi:hypothetical protein
MDNKLIRLAYAYYFIKAYVLKKGFSNEITWQENINFNILKKDDIIKEAAWVILSSGMSYNTVAKLFPKICFVFDNWVNLELIVKNESDYYNKVLSLFNHPGKINAIFYFLKEMSTIDLDEFKNNILKFGHKYFLKYPYLGPATSFHLYKNLGFQTSKPDRHLTRISKSIGYKNPQEMCEALSDIIYEKVSVIDLVIWRYSTLNRNYLNNLNYFLSK